MKSLEESLPEAQEIINENFWELVDTKETKADNMEEKELNLCEILKGHEEEVFYSPLLAYAS